MNILRTNNISQFKKGSGIHIKKKNRGKFTEYCNGKVTQECIDKAKRSNNPTLRKRATFAENARAWKHKKGGLIPKCQKGESLLSKAKSLVKKTYNDVIDFFTPEIDNTTPVLNDGDSHNNSIIIDKGRQHMYAYDQKGNLVFNTPVSTGAVKGNKTKEGDYKTPVGKFAISQFENNRDPKIFGAPEFWRLRGTGFKGIGIHGDAGHRDKLGKPASHGCIRIHRDSIAPFQQKVKPYAGQTVYILDENGKY